MKLIVVESPAKARTIDKFLGPGYTVVASYGHIRDLPSSAKEIPQAMRKKGWARLGVDTEEEFKPLYVVPADSKKHVTTLKKLLSEADELLLATDEDREGEAISWHVVEVLKPKIPVRRITFHEITQTAIEKALANPREVNRQVVRAQESRRILDRLYGYSLSPVLWKKVRTKLSAGRVQSVAVRLIVEREEERQAFQVAEYWDVEAKLVAAGLEFDARLIKVDGQRLARGKDFDAATGRLLADSKVAVLDRTRSEGIAAGSLAAQPWRVGDIDRKETRQRPSPPFITSTLQQAASSKLGMSPQRTMRVAQGLYEGVDLGGGVREGLITYMRTDSVTLSEKALTEAKSWISEQCGDAYAAGPRRYKTKAKTAQEAHEAIRPTDFARTPESLAAILDPVALKLYRLIWNRAVASQMSDALLDKTSVDLVTEFDESSFTYRSRGSVVRFDGFLKIYGGAQKDSLLPSLETGQAVGGDPDSGVTIASVVPLRHETVPPARYTEAALVKKLEEEGIGRPSTYAPIISTIQQRDYVLKKSGALMPTYIGMAVTHLMREHFDRYVDIRFTAKMEEDLDKIAAGQIDPVDFLSRFYGRGDQEAGLLADIDRQLPQIEYPAIPIGRDPESDRDVTVRIGRNYVYVQVGEGDQSHRATLPVDLLIDELNAEKAMALISARLKSREPIGQDPVSGQNVYALIGPYGPYLQLGESGTEEKPKRVSLPKGRPLEQVGLEEALRLLALPRVVGEDPETGQAVTAGLGRFGPYVSRGRVFAQLENEARIFEVTLDESLEKIRNKNKKPVLKELGNHPESGEPLQVIAGRYGPYVTDGKVNAKMPAGVEPTELTIDDALPLLLAAAERKRTSGGRRPRKKAAKKTAKKTTKKTAKKTAKKTSKKTAKKT